MKKTGFMKAAVLSLSLVAALSFGLSAALSVSAAEDVVVYDASTFSSFSGRTKGQVAKKFSDAYYSGATYKNGDSSTYYSTKASTVAPYNKGVISNDTQKMMTAMSNYYRWLIGANNFTIASTNSSQYASRMQAEALDRNFEFGHQIANSSKPSDMSDSIWNEGFTCTHNILAMGYTPNGAVTGWLNEGYNVANKSWGTLGHRDCIIDPRVNGVQYGYCGYIAVGKLLGGTNTFKETFSAFPAQGYMPTNAIQQGYSAWNVYVDPSKVELISGGVVTVKVTNLKTNKVETKTTTNDTARAGMAFMGTGSINISFAQPVTSSGSYVDGDSFKVEITGLKDVATGKGAKLVYTVNFFDVYKYAVSPVKDVVCSFPNLEINAKSPSAADFKKIATLLPKKAEVTNEFGYKSVVDFAGEWTVDTTKKCYVNKITSIPANMKDTNGLLSRVEIPYTLNPSTDDYVLSINPNPAIQGGGTTITFTEKYGHGSSNTIYKVSPSGTGYKSELKFDKNSPEFDSENTGWVWDSKTGEFYDKTVFNMKKVAASDAGDYLCVSDSYGKKVVSNVVALKVHSHSYTNGVCTCGDIANGLAKVSGVWGYYVNGKLQTTKTGIVQKAASTDKKWYFVKKGVYTTSTGISQKADGSSSTWYFVQDGLYTKNTGIAKKADGSSSTWYYVVDGIYTKGTGITKKADGLSSVWYYVENGIYTKNTGIAQKADGSSTTWFFVLDGVFTRNTGIAQKADGSSASWYYVSDGLYTKATGISKKADGSSATWYYVKSGVYTKATCIAPIAEQTVAKYYVKDGIWTKTTGRVTIGTTTYKLNAGVVV